MHGPDEVQGSAHQRHSARHCRGISLDALRSGSSNVSCRKRYEMMSLSSPSSLAATSCTNLACSVPSPSILMNIHMIKQQLRRLQTGLVSQNIHTLFSSVQIVSLSLRSKVRFQGIGRWDEVRSVSLLDVASPSAPLLVEQHIHLVLICRQTLELAPVAKNPAGDSPLLNLLRLQPSSSLHLSGQRSLGSVWSFWGPAVEQHT